MQITGRLKNASGTGNDDVFGGYEIEVRYFAAGDQPNTIRAVEDRAVCQGTDPSFGFTLPDAVSLEEQLEIVVRNRRHEQVHRETHVLVEVLRQPLVLPIQRIEPAVVVTPVTLKGRLQWKSTPSKSDGFGGFTILVSYQEATGGAVVARQATVKLAGPPAFTVALPAAEALLAPVTITATAPDGQTAATQTYELKALKEEVVLVVDAPQPIVVKTDTRAEDAQPERLKGKVVDLAGKVQIAQRQVILWGKSVSGVTRPLVVAVTDGLGNFAGERPKENFTGAWGTVAGTKQATLQTAVVIDLVEVTGRATRTGRMPPFVYLVVELDAVAAESDQHDACACDTPGTPRQPDPEDLVKNAAAYSQDIGPNCVNFTTPNRTLEEFVYSLVVRTTDPLIKGTTLSDLERRPTPGAMSYYKPSDVVLQSASPALAPQLRLATTAPLQLAKAGVDLSGLRAEEVSASPLIKALAAADRPAVWKNQYKTVPGRGELTANNSVDWDGTPTFYQASTIAHGHILYYKQIWKADGYSLGDLLYSLPLAPGQKKQIVVFDWDRTEYGRRDEASHEDEALNSYLGHNRDVLDITQGRVAEQLRGGSQSEVEGSAGGIGGGVGAMIGPVMIGVAGGFSSSSGSSSSSAWQDSSRDVASSGLNQLRDLIQQGASAVRNQRSTVVQTARQTERFRVETEVVANHNHCHAITIEYFEVLRHYAIEQQLTHVQECLFVPLLMSPFDVPKIMRWRDILRATLLLPPRTSAPLGVHPLVRGLEAAERLFLNYEGSDLPATTYAAEQLVDLTGELWISLRLNRPLDDDDNADDPKRQEEVINEARMWSATGWAVWWPFLPNGPSQTYAQYFAHQKIKYKQKIFDERVAPVLAEEVVNHLQFTAVTLSGVRHTLSVDTTLVSSYQRDVQLYVTVRPLGAINVRRDQIDYVEIASSADLSKSEQSKIIIHRVTLRYSAPHMNGHLARDYRVDNDLKPGDPVVIATPLSAQEKRNPREEDKYFSRLLIEHLNANLEYYHKAIWARMDSDRRYMLLDGFVAPYADGRSVASVVENRVIGVAGNCLIMPVAPGYKLDPSYEYAPELNEVGQPRLDAAGSVVVRPVSLLDHYKPLTAPPPYRVSVPTRGVFAEAVMGACNSCEKWDESRYWKWEEHPIPEEPTPIATVQTQPPQRSDPGALKPTPFPTPMINIQNAPASPGPGATLAGTLGLLGQSGIFPDITGLDQTQKNALQAMLSNQESAKHFADKASELALQAANVKTGSSTVDGIKQSMDDGSLDKTTGKRLIEDAYRAQINGQTAPDRPSNTANNADLAQAGATSVRLGRPVKVSTDHPDGTSTTVEQQKDTGATATTTAGETIDYVVPGKIFNVAQPATTNTCWATVAAMMVNWREGADPPRAIHDVIQTAGPKYAQLFDDGQGLPPADKEDFIARLGLVIDEGNLASQDYGYFLSKLKAYGPLWITFDVSDAKLALHARMLFGLYGEVTADRGKIVMRLVDPNDGQKHDMPFLEFVRQYESVAAETAASTPLPVQIVRFGQGGGGSTEGTGTPTFVPVPTSDPGLEGTSASALNPVQAMRQLLYYASQGVITLKGRSANVKQLKPIDNVELDAVIDGVEMRVIKSLGKRDHEVFQTTSTYPLFDVHPRNAVAIVRLIRGLKAKWPNLVAVLTQGVNVAPGNGKPKVITDTDTTSDMQKYHEDGRSLDFTGVVLRSTQQPGDFDALWILYDWAKKSVPDLTKTLTLNPAIASPNPLKPDWPSTPNTDAQAQANPLKFRLDYLVAEAPPATYQLSKDLTTQISRDLFREVYALARAQCSPTQGDIGTYGFLIHPDYPLVGGASNGRLAHQDHLHMNVPHYRERDAKNMWTGVAP